MLQNKKEERVFVTRSSFLFTSQLINPVQVCYIKTTAAAP
jgi:hypothetical protein